MIRTLADFRNVVEEILADYCSIENIEIKENGPGVVEINLDIDELNYVADILSIGKVEKSLESLNDYMMVGTHLTINLNVNMISPLDFINVSISI